MGMAWSSATKKNNNFWDIDKSGDTRTHMNSHHIASARREKAKPKKTEKALHKLSLFTVTIVVWILVDV